MTEQESAEVNFDDEFIMGPEEEEEDADYFEQINQQNIESKDYSMIRSNNDKRQKFDSADHEIKKQKAKNEAKK